MPVFGIYGASGCGRGILPLVRQQISVNDKVVFIDDGLAGQTVNGASVMSFAQFVSEKDPSYQICIAIADSAVRKKLADKCREAEISHFSVQSLNIVIMDDVSIGEGALFSPFTTVTSNVRIGRHFHCNLYSYVEHDCIIGDFVTFAPSVRCNGHVSIGAHAYIGAGAIIRQGISIGEHAVIGMGAVVVKDVPAGETWVGNPARAIKL